MSERPQPVLLNGGAAVIAALLAPIFAKVGVDGDGAVQIVGYVLAIVSAVNAIVALFRTRSLVTPLAAPRNNEGEALTPAGQ